MELFKSNTNDFHQEVAGAEAEAEGEEEASVVTGEVSAVTEEVEVAEAVEGAAAAAVVLAEEAEEGVAGAEVVGEEEGGGFKGGKTVVIEPHRHEGVFIARGKEDALVTLNLVPGSEVYGEKRISVENDGNKVEYRVWNPFEVN
ncbi:hypothetical protein NQ318_022048 [Aromia moschata]|uniref:Histone-glutamine methyltransferase n=1 Tax=Aromia moschata TaxID=1265417 RepID=A0AAV8Z5J8_9CUCU|nr:hypothetical protein NQ318_022048 [Aromia moschata]